MQPKTGPRRWMLAASLAANIVLGFAAFGRTVPTDGDAPADDPARARAGAGMGAAIAAGAGAGPGTGDALTAARLERLEALELTAMAEVEAAAAEYWRADGQYEIAYRQAALEARARIRDELLRRYGEDARTDPAFARLFRPFDPLYPFLSSAQQLALERLRFERDLAVAEASRSSGVAADSAMPPDAAAMPNEAVRRAESEYRRALGALLDDASRFELDLRDSALARQLRASGVDFSEREFREAFGILAALETGPGGIEAALAARESLAGLLGPRRNALLWAARDPTLARVDAVATAAGVAGSALPQVHELLDGFQRQRLDLARRAGTDPMRAADASLALAEQERDALARLVGEDAATAILRERAAESYRVFRGAPRRD